MASKRQQIVDAVKTRFATILTSGGFESNIGQNVNEWLLPSVAADKTQVMSVEDPECSTEQRMGDSHEHTLTIEASVGIKAASVTPAELRKAIADMTKAIGVDRLWGALALDTNPVGSRIELNQTDKIVGVAQLTFEIKYRTASWET